MLTGLRLLIAVVILQLFLPIVQAQTPGTVAPVAHVEQDTEYLRISGELYNHTPRLMRHVRLVVDIYCTEPEPVHTTEIPIRQVLEARSVVRYDVTIGVADIYPCFSYYHAWVGWQGYRYLPGIMEVDE